MPSTPSRSCRRALGVPLAAQPGVVAGQTASNPWRSSSAEQRPLTTFVRPILKQPPRRRRHPRIAKRTPDADAFPNLVDEPVLLDPVARPLGLQLQLAATYLRGRDRHEIGAHPPFLDDLVRDPRIPKRPMARRRLERRIQDRVLDDSVYHVAGFVIVPCSSKSWSGNWAAFSTPTRICFRNVATFTSSAANLLWGFRIPTGR